MQANWIAGAWRPARTGHVFRTLDGASSAESFPRSSDADVDDALRALAREEAAWRAVSESERRAALVRAAERFAREPDPGECFARRLGWSGDDAACSFEPLADVLVGSLREGPRAVLGAGFGARSGVVVVRRDWSELHAGLARAVFALLALGRGVLLLSDPAAPWLASALVHAFEDAPFSAPIALLHDDGSAVLQRALREPRVRGVSASGPSARLRELERWLNDAARGSPSPSACGAGLDEPPCAERALGVLRNQSRIVRRSADPVEEARAIVEGAFGRRAALSGQAPSSVGRVVCHERVFSRLSAALLEELARSSDVARPLRTMDATLVEHHRRAFELGLDEGATPVFTPSDRATVDGEPAPAGPTPIVFTNVEEHMRLAWLGRPAPILCLLRVDSDARGEELARALDQDPLAEDLSAESSPAGDEDDLERSTAQGGPAPQPMRPSPRASHPDAEVPENES